MYDESVKKPDAFEKITENWEVGVGMSDGAFKQISFVNSIATTKGGQHVNYIVDQVCAHLAIAVKKKNKGER
jgi:DNA topoisomerase-2